MLQAMDTSGRAILLAGTTVVIALLGMFATGVPFMYGLSIASVLPVLLTLIASLTVLPATALTVRRPCDRATGGRAAAHRCGCRRRGRQRRAASEPASGDELPLAALERAWSSPTRGRWRSARWR